VCTGVVDGGHDGAGQELSPTDTYSNENGNSVGNNNPNSSSTFGGGGTVQATSKGYQPYPSGVQVVQPGWNQSQGQPNMYFQNQMNPYYYYPSQAMMQPHSYQQQGHFQQYHSSSQYGNLGNSNGEYNDFNNMSHVKSEMSGNENMIQSNCDIAETTNNMDNRGERNNSPTVISLNTRNTSGGACTTVDSGGNYSVNDVFIPDPSSPNSGVFVCKHCYTSPPYMRAPGAIHNGLPSLEHVDQHLTVCQGNMNVYQGNFQTSYTNNSYPASDYANNYNAPTKVSSYPYLSSNSQGLSMTNSQGNAEKELGGNFEVFHPDKGIKYGSKETKDHMNRKRNKSDKGRKSARKKANSAAQCAEVILANDDKNAPLPIVSIDANDPDSLVIPDDRNLLTDYFLYMMQQLKVCYFKESDRKTRGGKRENIAVGFAGIQCRHCSGNSFARKFFWSDPGRLANSFSEIPSHVMMCRVTPQEVKTNLARLKKVHTEQLSVMPRGSQKVFIRRMWKRIHPNSPIDEHTICKVNRKKKRRNKSSNKKQDFDTVGSNNKKMAKNMEQYQYPPRLQVVDHPPMHAPVYYSTHNSTAFEGEDSTPKVFEQI